MIEAFDVVVIGGGQAGLATSYELTQAGVEHVVLERGRVGEAWRNRWDSFCLVTPNWTARLPGFGYDGDDPDGFMPRDELVTYFERYAASFEAPVREGVEVTSLEQSPDGGFVILHRVGRRVPCALRRRLDRRLPAAAPAAGRGQPAGPRFRRSTPRATATRTRCPTAPSS